MPERLHLLNEFSDAFLHAWDEKQLPAACRLHPTDLSLEEAYEVQRRVLASRSERGERVVGYKVGCTSKAIREQFGLSEPICGRLMAPHVHEADDSTFRVGQFVQCAIEPEFVLRMGSAVTSELDDRRLIDAIEWAAPGMELHNYKFWFGKPTSQELIASNGIHAALVIGSQRLAPQSLEFDLEGVGVFRNGELAASGVGAEIMGGPLHSLRWLSRHLLERGEHLQSGDLIIPGSPVKLVSAFAGDRITAAFTHVGQVTVSFR